MTAISQPLHALRSVSAPDNRGDLVDSYLRDVGDFALLTPEEEIALGIRVLGGDARATDELVTRNLRFVVSVAKQYQHRGLPLADLVGEGNLGLVTAAQKFDPARGARFISYAVWWIRQAITAALARQAHIVRIPAGQATNRRRVLRRADALRQELKREPTESEIAESAGISPEEVRSAFRMSSTDVSLDAPLDADGDHSLLDLLADGSEDETDAESTTPTLRALLERALSTLPPRDARIIRLHFGLEGEREHTLEDIGARLGVTRERVRQLRDRSLRRLRASSARSLAEFLPVQSQSQKASSAITPLSILRSPTTNKESPDRRPFDGLHPRVRAS